MSIEVNIAYLRFVRKIKKMRLPVLSEEPLFPIITHTHPEATGLNTISNIITPRTKCHFFLR